MRSRFLFKLFASYALLVLVNALLVEFFVARWVARAERSVVEDTLRSQAILLREAVRPAGPAPDLVALERQVQELEARTGTRFTVVAADGKVLADSRERPEAMENHLSRPEFVAAAAKGVGTAERRSATT